MLTKILAPLDGSPASESILAYVEMILAAKDANVTLVQVSEDERAARDYLSGIAHKLRSRGAVVDTAVLSGDPAQVLVDMTIRGGYSMVMMATRGKGALRRLLFGSTAEKILEHAAIPVFIAHPGEKVGLLRRIVVPLDGSHRSASILKPLIPLAKALGARMVFATIVSPVGKEDLPVDLAAKNLFAEQKSAEDAGVRTEFNVRYGDAATEILGMAEGEPGTLIALSTHGRTGLDKVRFGSVAEKLLRKGGFPMLVVRTAAIPKAQGTTPAALKGRRRALAQMAKTPRPAKGVLG
jgi:nucleotide-binding universal stress UspA family protein